MSSVLMIYLFLLLRGKWKKKGLHFYTDTHILNAVPTLWILQSNFNNRKKRYLWDSTEIYKIYMGH